MKQHITVEQLGELESKQYQKYLNLWLWINGINFVESIGLNDYERYTVGDDVPYKMCPLINIGQMIEFLLDKSESHIYGPIDEVDDDFCDCLWEAVKENL